MPNPFYFGGHVEPGQFVGRHEELNRIFSALDITNTGKLQSTSIVGPRGIGKSSLLYYVAHRYSNHLRDAHKYRFTYLSLKDPECKTQQGLLKHILIGLQISERVRGNITLVEFRDQIRAFKAGGGLPVILLDGFAELTEEPNEFTPDLFNTWRSLIGDGSFAFITASIVPLSKLEEIKGYTSRFSNIFSLLQLDVLAPDAAEELIQRGAKCDRPFTTDEQKHMRDLGRQHPYKLQLAGSLIYNAKQNSAPVKWKNIRRDFNRQVNVINGNNPPPEPKTGLLWLKRIAEILDAILIIIGRIILKRLGSGDKATNREERIVGVVVIVIIIVAFVVFNPEPIVQWLVSFF